MIAIEIEEAATLRSRFARQVLGQLRRRNNLAQSTLWQEAWGEGHVWQRQFYDFVVRTEVKKVESCDTFIAIRSGVAWS